MPDDKMPIVKAPKAKKAPKVKAPQAAKVKAPAKTKGGPTLQRKDRSKVGPAMKRFKFKKDRKPGECDVLGCKVARLRDNRATKRRNRRMKHGTGLYRPLVEGLFIPLIEGTA